MDRLALIILLGTFGFAHSIPLKRDCRPSSKDIELVRESWKTQVSKNSIIPVHTLIELIKAHPKVKSANPVFKDVSIEDLPKTPAFLKRAFFLYGFLMNFVVNVIDNEAVLRDSLQRLETVGELYAPGMTKDKQNKESIKFYLLELEHEEPNMTLETRQAWSNCLNYAISFLGRVEPQNPVCGTSVLTPEELEILRIAFKAKANNLNIPIKAFQKLFEYHPMILKAFQERIPMMATATLEELDENHPAMKFLAFNLISATSMIVMNADNDELLVEMIKENSKPENFVDYIDPKYQLDEFRRLLMESAREEGAPEEQITVFNKILKHAFDVMALYSMSPKQVDKWKNWKTQLKSLLPEVTGKFKKIIRDSWISVKYNSDIVPNALLKVFDEQKEVISDMLPGLPSKITRVALGSDRNFLLVAYRIHSMLDQIVENLDDIELIAIQMWKQSLSHWYVNKPNFRQHSEIIAKAFINAMSYELGDLLFNEEQRTAWKILFDQVTNTREKMATSKQLDDEEKKLIQDTWGVVKRNPKFGNDVLLKFFRSYPRVAKHTIPKLADVPINELGANEKFMAYGDAITKVMDGLIDHIDDADWRSEQIKERNLKQYLDPRIPARLQLSEYAEILIDAVDEELGPRSSKATSKVWMKAAKNLIVLIMQNMV